MIGAGAKGKFSGGFDINAFGGKGMHIVYIEFYLFMLIECVKMAHLSHWVEMGHFYNVQLFEVFIVANIYVSCIISMMNINVLGGFIFPFDVFPFKQSFGFYMLR